MASGPVTGMRPHTGLPLILLYVACLLSPLVVVLALVERRRARPKG
ncbi:MAG TPA: hypothetical protein VJ870_07465 [Amycolatopsis sp.]|nr:hypothetical protein [Amycolatopsis sp.]